ncbi:MHYT domain-containing protein [Bradyrhizobium sp. S3.2.12]|uniref:MHYT domain-containing protein n=1 Tax=Bradyrhizobium sp. S3.2.12 TaxID=3156387 RepID=UPI00339558CD
MVITPTYDPSLVVLSILVAGFASYTALDLGGRVALAQGPTHRIWLAGAALTMGAGIWSMHFVAMLAFMLPMPVSYDVGLTVLSLVLAILGTSGSFYFISRPGAWRPRLVLSGVFMGFGILAMHYTGMAAMRGPVELSYDPLWVALSVIVAIGAATAALWLAFGTKDPGRKLAAAIVLGFAISGMHYTGMRAAICTAPATTEVAQEVTTLDRTPLAVAIAGFVLADLAALFASAYKRKRADEALRQTRADLAHVQRVTAMGELAASITHEVMQPLGAGMNNAGAALRWLDGQPPNLDKAREALGRTVENGERAAQIIGRIRSLVKKEPPRKDALEVNEAIAEVVALTRGEVMKNNVSVQTQLAEGLPLIQGDRVQLQQVILNLIINAVQAMSGVSEGSRELLIGTGKDASGRVLVSVQDSGPGLNPESFERLFDSFYTTKPGGMGMGLSICRSIVEAHGGRIWATPNAGSGITVLFTLPINDQAMASARSAA